MLHVTGTDTWDPPNGKFGKSIDSKCHFWGDMLVPWRVYIFYILYIYIYMNIDYLPTLSAKWPHEQGEMAAGKDSLRGAFGLHDMNFFKPFWGCLIGMPQ